MRNVPSTSPSDARVRSIRTLLCSVVLAVACFPAAAQWVKYPTPGIPRTPDGKPNLNAPAPKLSDGKPDLSGVWGLDYNSGLYDKELVAKLFREEVGPDLSLFIPTGAEIPMQPSAKALYAQLERGDHPSVVCRTAFPTQ